MVPITYRPESTQQWRKDSLEGWEDFLKNWPIENLGKMKIEDYVYSKDNPKTFCSGLERVTRAFAPVKKRHGSSIYGVYYSEKKKSLDVNGMNLSPEDAFKKIKERIVKIANAARTQHVDEIQKIIRQRPENRLITSSVIWKIALLYQPIYEPYLMAVCTTTKPKEYWPGIRSLQEMQERFESERGDKDYWDFSYKLIYQSIFSKDGSSLSKQSDLDDSGTQNIKSHYVEEILNALKKKKNVIIEGAPGTGKTFITREVVVRLCDDVQRDLSQNKIDQRYEELVRQGRVSLTTFHPALDYEDFVEGYKPTDTKNKDTASCPEFTLRDGIFKSICKSAEKGSITSVDPDETGADLIGDTAKVWKVSLLGSGDNPVRSDCLENGRIRIGWDDLGEEASQIYDMPTSSKVRQAIHNFQKVMKQGDVVLSCYNSKEVDAIGVVTGEYKWIPAFSKKEGYCRTRSVKWLYKGRVPVSQINEDFKLTLSTVYQLKRCKAEQIRDLLRKLNPSKETKLNQNKAYVLIIDEINRGNIPKVFGELITLLENDKREILKAKLPYSQIEFSVPKNLYILGTMNTADRSIGGVDYALRRRFAFVRLRPEKLAINGFDENLFNAVCKLFVKDPTASVWEANREYLSDEFLPEDVCPGQSYFIMNGNMDSRFRFKYEILPLLEEYLRDGVLKPSAVDEVRILSENMKNE